MTIVNQVMKRLVVDELRDTLTQGVSFSLRTTIQRIMPHLYIQGSPTGSIRLRLLKDATTVSETTHDLADVTARAGKTLANYHGYVSFEFLKPPICAAGDYTIELEAVSYAFDEETLVGWVMLPSDPTQTSLLTLPHDLRVVEIRAP